MKLFECIFSEMDSVANRLRSVLMLESRSQRLGAWLRLLSSIAFSPFFLFPRHHGLTAGFVTGALLAHGRRRTSDRFLENLGVNFYIIGWAFMINGLFIANTYLEVYFISVAGVNIVFLGVVLYFIRKEHPTRWMVANHVLSGAFLLVAGAALFSLAHSRVEINLFYLVRVGRLPEFLSHRAAASALVGFGILLISLFMYFIPA